MHFHIPASESNGFCPFADFNSCQPAGLQLTSVELIKVSSGGIVIPVATVETQSSGGGSGISGGAIAGIIIGVVGGLALLGRESSPSPAWFPRAFSYLNWQRRDDD